MAALAILVALAAFVWLWWLGVPALYADVADVRPPDRLAAVTMTRTALLAGLVGVGAVGAFWRNARAHRFMAESLRLAEENLRQTTRGQEETLRLTERGHLTDRYGKAIEQLGSDKLDVRLGGIYALEQFANDTDHDRDQATVVEVLSAFVRVHSQPVYQYREYLSLLGSAPMSDSPEELILKSAKYVGELDRPPEDVQTAVTVLGRLPVQPNVERADFSSARLPRISLANSNFVGARLVNTDLTAADLTEVNLTFGNLRGANLTSARVVRALLVGANLQDVDLAEANLHRADLRNTFLAGSNLANAYARRVDLCGAVLRDAHLNGAELHRAVLTTTKGLTQEQIDSAEGDSTTGLPDGLKRPARWPSEWTDNSNPQARPGPTGSRSDTGLGNE